VIPQGYFIRAREGGAQFKFLFQIKLENPRQTSQILVTA